MTPYQALAPASTTRTSPATAAAGPRFRMLPDFTAAGRRLSAKGIS